MTGLVFKKNARDTFILLHFIIFSIGLVKLTKVITGVVYSKLHFNYTLSLVYSWMCSDCSDPLKLPVLLHYLSSLFVLFLFYTVCFWVLWYSSKSSVLDSFFGFDSLHNSGEVQAKVQRGVSEDSALSRKRYKQIGGYDLFSNKKINIIIYLSASLIFNLIYFLSSGHLLVMGLSMLWLLFSLYLPFQYLKLTKIVSTRQMKNRFLFSNTSYYVLILIVIMQFLFLFYPLCFKKMLVVNEYMDIPEKTILENHVVVDNTDFIKAHKIGGFIKYDPRIDNGATPEVPENKRIKLSYAPMLDYFVSIYGREYKYNYDKKNGVLSLKGEMTSQDHEELLSFYKFDFRNQKAINQLFITSIKEARFFKSKAYSNDETNFINKNMLEIRNQTRAGWFFFHHSWMLNSILAVAHGAGFSTQPFIYGLGSAYTVSAIMKCIGGIDYQTYFKVIFSFYPIYFVLFLVVIFAIFKRLDYLLMAAMLLSCAIYAVGDEVIRLAPGYNPIRHLFDMPVFLLYFYYVRRSKIVFLLCSMILCVGSVLWSKDFGICLLIAISVTETIRLLLDKHRQKSVFFTLALSGLFGILIYFLGGSKNPNLIYMLLGLGTPSTPPLFIILALIFVSVVSLFYVKLIRNYIDNPMFALSLSLFFYIQLSLIYFIWNPSPHHLLVVSIPGILFLLTWYNMCEATLRDKCNGNMMALCLAIVFVFLYLPVLGSFYYERVKINQIFSGHVVYDWKLKNASFQSTMDPELFQQSIDLINEYDKAPSIYLISKYDSLLTVIADKYNAIPTVNVALDLISKKTTNAFWSVVQHNAPEYIFMDTDINRSFNGDIIDSNDHMAANQNYIASLGRAAMLTNLKNLSCRVAVLYKPVKQGKLITVYKRRDDAQFEQEIECP